MIAVGTLLRAVFLTLGLLVMAVADAGEASAQAQQPRARPQSQRQQEEAPPRPRIDYEAVLYSQPRMIDEVLAGIKPSDRTEPSTYFIGFASWSEQDVFIREVAKARDIVDERFGTRDRSLLLVNHHVAVDEVPLASVSNLEMVTARLAKIMNPEKDTLILFLTSHGIEGLFAVQFPGFPLNHLTPQRLARILDRSGIKNRIIIISACHSGSFIPALRHATTMVMTAARADRTSFGCSNESEWTWFGDALFNHALRQTTSLPQAFEMAKGLIGTWEARDRFKPSEPQIFVGDEVGPFIARLAALPPPAIPAAPITPLPGAD